MIVFAAYGRSSNAGHCKIGWRGYFVGSAVHIRNLDVFVAMVRLFAQRWQMLSGKGRVSSAFAPDAGGFTGLASMGRWRRLRS